ncbi:MAG: hypothetical protein DWQ47_12720 [Acidobacteria bacterium]|nr:MAG: hypothetical protein DWQ32_00120 [Acidobacteriota bacterium]REK03051.1 MAG: hypothetical protein DWQ38_12015 [Acidobacteriota bacterium]REK13145.1 MAG: hypothetical protein DWQ43_05810 [Acidobacteriota bacterium]REK41139.1 MAG: hypothetical protein DWQ47_12720 [Acidobacteriota bacterium]
MSKLPIFLFVLVIGILLLSVQISVFPQERIPWLSNIGAMEKRDSITSIRSTANVTVSDGKEYLAESFYVDPQRSIFRIKYPDRTLTQGVEGKYFWSFDGKEEKEGTPQTETIVLGHQFHAQILFFDQIHRGSIVTEEQSPLSISVADDRAAKWSMVHDSGVLRTMIIEIEGGPTVVNRFSDFRRIDGVLLPHAISIDDGERTFTYKFTSIEFNKGSLGDYRAPEAVLTDEQKLLRYHRIVMDDHFFENVDGMKSINSDMIVVSRGEVSRMSEAESDAGFDRIVKGKDHYIYDDLIRPIVKISEDGTLGWVIVRVYAKGTYLDEEGEPTEPLEFTSAWIEMYEKIKGRWLMVGNVSNFVQDE